MGAAGTAGSVIDIVVAVPRPFFTQENKTFAADPEGLVVRVRLEAQKPGDMEHGAGLLDVPLRKGRGDMVEGFQMLP